MAYTTTEIKTGFNGDFFTDEVLRDMIRNNNYTRQDAIVNRTSEIEARAIECNVRIYKELNRRFHAEQAMLNGIEEAYNQIVLDEIFASFNPYQGLKCMPAPNHDNPICPVCGKPTTYNCTTKSGSRQYRCRRHKPNYIVTDSDRPHGSEPIGDRPMTSAERVRRHRAKKRASCVPKKRGRPKKE